MTKSEEIEARKAEIRTEVEAAQTTEEVEKLNEEVEALNEEEKALKEHAEERKVVDDLATGKISAKKIEKEEKSMEEEKKELRNSKAYIDAFASNLKAQFSKDHKVSEEERALLTQGAEDGVVAVPDLVDDVIRTAWERETLMGRVRTISVQGNFSVQFEVSGDPAVVHDEGSGEVEEEDLVLGIKTIIPKFIKKWISVSDEVMGMRGEAFLRYIYDELTYRIAKRTADVLINKIKALPQSLTANEDGVYDEVSANKLTAAPTVGTIPLATAKLNPEATDITIVMNRETDANFVQAQLQANYGFDVFRGATKVYTDQLPAYDSATAGAIYAIVGDFNLGAMANYPEGDDIRIVYDDVTLATQDLVRIIGKRYVGVEPVADKAFVLIAKPQTV